MGLITKKVKVRWHVNNRKHYEKIGYVFDNVNSELYELLTSPEYKDKIELLPGTTA